MKRIKKIILIILIVFSLTMIVFNMYKILIWHSDNNENEIIKKELRELVIKKSEKNQYSFIINKEFD